jgi:hypothetical protein
MLLLQYNFLDTESMVLKSYRVGPIIRMGTIA